MANIFKGEVLLKIRVKNLLSSGEARVFIGQNTHNIFRMNDEWMLEPTTYFNGSVNTFGEVIVALPRTLVGKTVVLRVRNEFGTHELDYLVREDDELVVIEL